MKAPIAWKPPSSPLYKVNTNGSYNVNSGTTSCGGFLRDSDDKAVRCFYKKYEIM